MFYRYLAKQQYSQHHLASRLHSQHNLQQSLKFSDPSLPPSHPGYRPTQGRPSNPNDPKLSGEHSGLDQSLSLSVSDHNPSCPSNPVLSPTPLTQSFANLQFGLFGIGQADSPNNPFSNPNNPSNPGLSSQNNHDYLWNNHSNPNHPIFHPRHPHIAQAHIDSFSSNNPNNPNNSRYQHQCDPSGVLYDPNNPSNPNDPNFTSHPQLPTEAVKGQDMNLSHLNQSSNSYYQDLNQNTHSHPQNQTHSHNHISHPPGPTALNYAGAGGEVTQDTLRPTLLNSFNTLNTLNSSGLGGLRGLDLELESSTIDGLFEVSDRPNSPSNPILISHHNYPALPSSLNSIAA